MRASTLVVVVAGEKVEKVLSYIVSLSVIKQFIYVIACQSESTIR